MVWAKMCTNSGECSAHMAVAAGIQSRDEEAFMSCIESQAAVQPNSAIYGG
jgi:hypothetical protein